MQHKELVAWFKGTAGQYRSMSTPFATAHIETNALIRKLYRH